MQPKASLTIAFLALARTASASFLGQFRLFSQSTTIPSSTSSASTTSTTYLSTCPTGFTYPGACHDVGEIPAKAQCNKPGHLESDDAWGIVYNGMRQDQPEDCAFICHLWQTCQAYGFNSSDPDTPCRFYEKRLADAGLVEEPDAATSWYDVGCSECTRCGTVPPSIVPGLPDKGPRCSLKKDVDAQYICNRAGIVSAGARFYETQIYPHNATAENCATTCANHGGCRASAYDPAQGPYACLFSGYSLRDASFEETAGSQVWSDEACWECPKWHS